MPEPESAKCETRMSQRRNHPDPRLSTLPDHTRKLQGAWRLAALKIFFCSFGENLNRVHEVIFDGASDKELEVGW
jgi:hypothetical protein